ncbi:two-component regulator propeller domain-containing protein [Herbaspirillum sp. SJZ107]|uniref:hybrid sensor histidine kinase/response regulator n=1 Tax=Herbaspirillum sp. SJZ107 TaxID=2572881 RepID=UPI00114F8631|nr:two-component regulator propeller domain-containing protein [Herbaspirillum sp. SJZ107]TQK10510.1 signal transduction histidine kinase [Herbaspirillum sp. SJZ107]
MIRRFLFATLALLLVLATPGMAAPAPTLRFEHLSVENGLLQESVLAIVQDSEGFMWFGTQSGLSRYDGYRFTSYRNVIGDPRTLINNWVRVLYVDRKGRLWIGTDGGLDRFEPSTGSFTHFQPNEPAKRGNGNRHIRAILDDGKDGLWLATADGLQHFDINSGRFTIWHHVPGVADSLASDKLTSLALDARGRLWIGSSLGLDSLGPDHAHFRHHPSPQGGAYDVIQALLVDPGQHLWVGSMGGLERLPLGQSGELHRFGLGEGMPAGEISVLYQDAGRQIWVGSHDRGLYRWQPEAGTFAHHPHRITDSYSLGDNQVSALYADRVGTFWVGTWYGGVSRADMGSGGFARIVRGADSPIALEDNKVRGIVGDGAGKLWLATNGGLHRFDPASGEDTAWRLAPVTAGLTGDAMATAVALGPDGAVWAGARNGLARLDPASGRIARRSLSKDVDANSVRNLLVTRDGVLWIATRGGLHRLDPRSGGIGGALTTWQHDPASSTSLADNVVRPMLEDRQGRLWVGTFDGLDLLDRASGRFRHFRHDPNDAASLSHDEVHYLLEDRHGTLWVGTAVGLNKMVIAPDGTPRFQRYTRREGMEDDAVAALQEDLDGFLWVSTSSGLSRLDPVSGIWRNYNSADGTIEGAYFDASSLRAPDGTLYFGGNNGITAFNPRALHDNSIAPRAVITGLQIFGQPVQLAHPGLLQGPIERVGGVTLPASDSVFSLEFSALHFAAPGRNRFAYRLSGFDQEWISADAGKRFATYTNLDPGTYSFEVRAANKDGVWSDAAASIDITILPPYWKTWWFRSLCALLVGGIGYGAYRVRLDGLRRQKDLLEHQVGVRTEKIEQQNRLLERQTEELREQQRQVRRRTDELARANNALKENEEGLYLAKQRAEDATRQKSEFLANMSHEMRTPLAGVIGMLGFALRDGQLKASTREQILRGRANAESLLAIINDLLDFSKIEAGKLTIEHIDFALDETIGQVVTLFEEQAGAHSVGFALHLDPDLPRFVEGDPTRLRQILVNLVGNAFKFTHSGQVTVRVERRQEDQWDAAGRNMIRFSVEDTGIGIAADALPRLFQQFEQADATTTRRYGGTGLGLAICRQLVDLMGGTIGAVSTPGTGSTFNVLLPLADGVAPPVLSNAPREPHTHRLRVLCAEDYPTNQIIVRMMLEELGHQVDVVDNGLLAVRACAHTRYDMILMDGRMPEMDGASATRLIREGGSRDAPVIDQHLMIVALTANVSEEDRSRYLACGMDAFLTKPIDDTQLHYYLTRAIERQLQRGIPLAPMPPREARAPAPAAGAAPVPSTADLDAMFGVFTGALPEAPAPAPAPAPTGLHERMRSAFTADLPRRRAELQAALGAGDLDAAGRLLHGMRGSAGYLGEDGLHALCGELEREADGGRLHSVRRRLPQLLALLARFEASTV